MILDAVPPREIGMGSRRRSAGLSSFLDFLQRKLGVTISYDAQHFPFSRPDLAMEFELAERLRTSGVISSFYPLTRFPDDPPYKLWGVTCADRTEMKAGGVAIERDADALTAALAEALERYIWKETTDYFRHPVRASVRDMQQGRRSFVAPDRFAGFSKEQRKEREEFTFTDTTPFLWIEGCSLVSGKRIFVPTQTVSGVHLPREPMLRSRNTTGLATWPTQTGAQLNGVMECVERDAYMIMWLNQLTLPRLKLDDIRAAHSSLANLLATCERYRMKVHVVPLLTDAPAHAIMCVIEDLSGQPPRFAVGLKAHRSLSHAIEKALLEALRAHRSGRTAAAKSPWDNDIPVKDIGHYDRTDYWAVPEHARRLEFLISGKEIDSMAQEWDNDTDEKQLQRVVAWCREKQYECVSIPLTRSSKNLTSLHVEMMVIPELHPMHLFEKDLGMGQERLRTVPMQFGLASRKEAFTERPHPFA